MRVVPSNVLKPSSGVIVSGVLPPSKDIPASLPATFMIDTKNALQPGNVDVIITNSQGKGLNKTIKKKE